MDFETMGEEILGDDVLGYDDGYATVGALRVPNIAARRLPAAKTMRTARIAVPPKPAWRNRLAPGVPQPGYGLQPLPLQPSTNSGVFTSAVTSITYTARPQAPFRPERLIVIIGRSAGATAASRILGTGLFVGRNLQLVELANFDLEVFTASAFGVRLALEAAAPGELIQVPCVVGGTAIPAMESITVTMMFLGQAAC